MQESGFVITHQSRGILGALFGAALGISFGFVAGFAPPPMPTESIGLMALIQAACAALLTMAFWKLQGRRYIPFIGLLPAPSTSTPAMSGTIRNIAAIFLGLAFGTVSALLHVRLGGITPMNVITLSAATLVGFAVVFTIWYAAHRRQSAAPSSRP